MKSFTLMILGLILIAAVSTPLMLPYEIDLAFDTCIDQRTKERKTGKQCGPNDIEIQYAGYVK